MNTQIKRKLHGSVLLTVVFVMSILIVFLFGTLALALAANNRAHVNYSSAQTSITARSVAESAVAALDTNVAGAAAYKDAVGALEASSTPLKVKVGLSTPDTNENLATMGHIDDVTISYAGTKKFFKDGEWEDRDLLKFTSNVTMSGVTSSASVYVLKQEKGDNDNDDSSGAGFVTTAGVSVATQTSIWGGAYISLPTLDDAKAYDYKDEHIDRGFGNITEDGHRMFLDNSGAVIEAEMYVNDNVYINDWSGFVFPKEGTGIAILGDLYFTNNAKDHVVYKYHGKKDNLNFTQVPHIYVDGHIFSENGKIKLGNAEENPDDRFPLNTFCGWIDSTHAKSVLVSNIYCMDKDKTSTISGCNNTLYMWSNSVFQQVSNKSGATVVNGEVCTKGDLVLEDCEIAGDVRVEGDLTINGSVTVKGNVVVKGSIINAENLNVTNGGAIYNDGVGGTTVQIPNAIGYYYVYTPTEVTIGEGDEQKTVWVDPSGNPIHTGYVFNDGIFNEGAWVDDAQVYGVDEIKLYYTIRKPNEGEIFVDSSDPNNIDYSYGLICSRDGRTLGLIDEESNEFYAHTEVVSFVDETNYTLDVDYSIKESEATFTYTYGSPQGYNTYLEDRGEKPEHVYPEYAERRAILGLDTLKDSEGNEISSSNYKIVKTMEEVLTQVANPYENRISDTGNSLPKKLQDLYKEMTAADSSYTYKTFADFKQADGSYVIKNSCMFTGDINGADISDPNRIFRIDPGSENILIIMKDVETSNNAKIVVNDKDGGKVYIIVEGTMKLKNSMLVTDSYYDLIKEAEANLKTMKIQYNSSEYADDPDVIDLSKRLGTRVKPNINIYGSADSKLWMTDGYYPVSANILSPDMDVQIDSAGEQKFAEVYYNNEPMFDGRGTKEIFFGCMLSQNTKIPNSMNVMYVTDGKKHGDGDKEDGDPFWYKILYYNEF